MATVEGDGGHATGPARSQPEVDGYELLEELGRGGFATVHRAVQTSVGRQVALKVLRLRSLDEAGTRRFHREVRAVGSLSGHPHVVAVYDAGTTTDGEPFISMQLVEDGSWGDRVRRDGPLDAEQVRAIGADVADTLEAAHLAGITHRDIKPDNLLIGPRGRTLVSDFGIATLGDGTQTATGTVTGTLAYTAPELLRGGRADAASDVFALGATLHALLTGRSPFSTGEEDHAGAVIWRVVNEEPAPLPATVPEALRAVIADCTAKDPARRPPVTQLRERLEAQTLPAHGPPAGDAAVTRSPPSAGGDTVVVPGGRAGGPPPGAGSPAPSRARARWLVPLVAVVLAAAAAGGAAALSSRAGSEDPGAVTTGPEAADPPTGATTEGVAPVPEVASSFVVRDDPTGIAADGSDVWVTHYLDGTVSRIDPDRDQVTASIEVESFPDGIAVAESGVWVTHSATEGSVSRIDPASGRVVARIPVGGSPGSVAVTDGAVWVANEADGTVSHIDPGADEVVATIDVGDGAFGVVAGAGGVWVATLGNEVRRIDPATDEVVASVPVGVGPRGVAVAGGAVWVTETVAGTVSRVDPELDQVGATAKVGPDPLAIVAVGADLWVALSDSIARVDATTGAVTGTLAIGPGVEGLAAAGDVVWAVASDSDEIVRVDL